MNAKVTEHCIALSDASTLARDALRFGLHLGDEGFLRNALECAAGGVENYRIALSHDGDVPVGVGLVDPTGTCMVFVLPDYRDQGRGSKLMQALQQVCKREPVVLSAWYGLNITASRRFWNRLNISIAPENPYLSVASKTAPEFIML